MNRAVLVLFILILVRNIFPQESDTIISTPYKYYSLNYPIEKYQSRKEIDVLETEINYPVLGGIAALSLGAGYLIHKYQLNAWWKDNRQDFHFVNDWEYAMWQDKIGHFYATYLLAHGFSAGLEAANMDLERSAVYGGLAALAFELYIEYEDGFGPNWGFSPGDAAFDVLGAGYSVAQYYIPFLKNFQVKISYYPSQEYRDGTHEGNVSDDYEGQKYWLSLRMKQLLPESVAEFWPAFLNLAIGRQVKNLNGSGGGDESIYIALDLDAEEIPLYGKGWQFVKNTLNYLHLPMPGIRISPNTVFFGLCY